MLAIEANQLKYRGRSSVVTGRCALFGGAMPLNIMAGLGNMVSVNDFLSKIPRLEEFNQIPNFSYYAPVPEEWSVFVCDVVSSTKAIESGRYKDVNVVGSSAVMAAVNAVKPMEILFSFGGDGATLLCPPEHILSLRSALLGVREMAQSAMNIELRVGEVPMRELIKASSPVKVARIRLSQYLWQTAMAGEGIALAETWVKTPPQGKNFLVPTVMNVPPPDLTGLECRWKPIKSERGKIVSVLVASLSHSPETSGKDYAEILASVDNLKKTKIAPIGKHRLKLSGFPGTYLAEARARQGVRGRLFQGWHMLGAYLLTMVAKLLWSTVMKPAGDQYKNEVVENSDFRKFDGVLRMVLDLDLQQQKQLQDLLEQKMERGEIVYGIHQSDTALLTCLIFNRAEGKHLHFVDGGDGGYALAGKLLKARVQELQSRLCAFELKPRRAS